MPHIGFTRECILGLDVKTLNVKAGTLFSTKPSSLYPSHPLVNGPWHELDKKKNARWTNISSSPNLHSLHQDGNPKAHPSRSQNNTPNPQPLRLPLRPPTPPNPKPANMEIPQLPQHAPPLAHLPPLLKPPPLPRQTHDVPAHHHDLHHGHPDRPASPHHRRRGVVEQRRRHPHLLHPGRARVVVRGGVFGDHWGCGWGEEGAGDFGCMSNLTTLACPELSANEFVFSGPKEPRWVFVRYCCYSVGAGRRLGFFGEWVG